MEQDVYRIEDEAERLRRLSPREQRRTRRNRAAAFILTFVAILLGAGTGLVWMNQSGLLQDDPFAEPAVAAETNTPAPENAPAANEDGNTEEAALTEDGAQENTELSALEPDTLPADTPGNEHGAGDSDTVFNTEAPIAGPDTIIGSGQAGRSPESAATSAARIQEILAQRGPTATPTPVPVVAQIDAVVALGGADLWDDADGVLIGRLAQGTPFIVRERSADSQWLLGTSETGASGWVEAAQLIAFDTSRLAAREVSIAPATPTPEIETILFPTPTPDTGGNTAAPVGSTLVLTAPDGGPGARIALQDARLNVRAGPGPHHAIVTKAHPDEVFAIIGRSAQGDWLQLAIDDVEGGFGWATTEYVEIIGTLDDTPVADAQNDLARPYTEGAEAERVRRQREASRGSTGPHHIPVTEQAQIQPADTKPETHLEPATPRRTSRVVAAESATGLHGKLAIQTSWGGDIYLYDLATGDLRLLTGGFDPALSPDGTQVAFTRGGGEHGLYLINTDGTNERMIFSGRELLRSPSWSPNGQWIVFERADEFTDCRDVGRRCPSDQQPRPGYPAGIMRQPMLARVDVHGGNYRDLGVLQSARAPDWSDAGVVYASAAGIQLTQDEPPHTVTQEVYFNIQKQYELSPALQPGGDTVLFQRREASHWEIYRVGIDGEGLHALTRPAFTLVRQLPANVAPAWSPDGRHIAFLSNRQPDHEAGEWAIWVMDADGGNQRPLPIELPLTYTYIGERMLSWGP